MIQKIKKILKERSMKKEQNRQEVWQKIISDYLDENVVYPDASTVAEHIDLYDLAQEVDVDASDIAYHLDICDIAYEIDVSDIAYEIDVSDVACNISVDDVAEYIDIDALADLVSELSFEDVCSNVEEKFNDEVQEKVIELFEDNFAAALSDMRDNIIDDVTTEIGMRLANIGECE